MRSVLVYGLVAFYFLISIRLTADIHYCKGEIKSISFVGFGESKKCCKKPGCCKNVHFSLKKSGEDQRVHTTAFMLVYPVAIPQVHYFSFEKRDYYIPREIVPNIKAPPPEVFPPVIIRNCVFRI